MRLSDLKLGEKGIITGIHTKKVLKERLFNMGVREGNTAQVVRFAPLLDPIEIYTCGFYLSIRKEDAFNITVERI